jgi:hypothetical protein
VVTVSASALNILSLTKKELEQVSGSFSFTHIIAKRHKSVVYSEAYE